MRVIREKPESMCGSARMSCACRGNRLTAIELKGGRKVSVGKVIEISATSPDSFEDAIRAGIAKAGETVRDIRGAWVKEQMLRVDGGNVVEFRVCLKITFVLE